MLDISNNRQKRHSTKYIHSQELRLPYTVHQSRNSTHFVSLGYDFSCKYFMEIFNGYVSGFSYLNFKSYTHFYRYIHIEEYLHINRCMKVGFKKGSAIYSIEENRRKSLRKDLYCICLYVCTLYMHIYNTRYIWNPISNYADSHTYTDSNILKELQIQLERATITSSERFCFILS